MKQYVIVGNGVAAAGCIEGIRRQDAEGKIVVVSQEEYAVYCRPLISYYLEGKTDLCRMGYRDAGSHRAFSCTAAADPVPLRSISPEEFARRRKELLPGGSVIQEGRNLAFLSQLAEFYAGDGFLMAACREGDCLTVPEFLGDSSLCPGILCSLSCETGTFRSPGGNAPFAMALPLQENAPEMAYFGFAFD